MLLLFTAFTSYAQVTLLDYGTAVLGTLSSQSPLAIYGFNGNAGERVTVQVISLTPGFTVSTSINAPTQQQLALGIPDPVDPGTLRASYRLTDTGFHTVIISTTGATGDYLVRLTASPPFEAQPLTSAPLSLTLTPDLPSQFFYIDGNPGASQIVNVVAESPDFAFGVVLRDSSGEIVGSYTGSGQQAIALSLPAGTMRYEIEVLPLTPGQVGVVIVSVGTSSASTGSSGSSGSTGSTGSTGSSPQPTATVSGSVPNPVSTTEVTGGCVATNLTGAAINVRGGPGTNFALVSSMAAGASLSVVGSNSGWYAVYLPNGQTAWVFGDLVTLSGDCTAVPFVNPNQPIATPTYTYTPTSTTTGPTPTYTYTQPGPTATFQQVGPTATYTNTQPGPTATYTNTQPGPTATYTYTPTHTYTPTYTPTTPPPPPEAPADSNYALVIPLDSTASITDFVSYPGGDREDRVSYRVTGMNPSVAFSGGQARMVITASCFGTGTQNVTFFASGQTYSCGQTVVDRIVNFDSNTGGVTITAVAGPNTYVQWVLTATVTRTN
jgi:uncharacterized protein YraI